MHYKNKSAQSQKTRVTPLYLLSQIKRSVNQSLNRHTALEMLEQEHKKITSRYGEILKNGSMRKTRHHSLKESHQRVAEKGSVNSAVEEQVHVNGLEYVPLRNSHYEQGREALSKIEKILSSNYTGKKKRYNSGHKPCRSKDLSPYLKFSELRRRSETEMERVSTEPTESDVNSTQMLRLKVQTKQKAKEGSALLPQLNQDRQVAQDLQQENLFKIFAHLDNLVSIAEAIEDRAKDRDIIGLVRNYIIDERGDASLSEYVYACEQTRQTVRAVLFIEKVSVILLVDLVLAMKYKSLERYMKILIRNLIAFYAAMYCDLASANKITLEHLINIEEKTKVLLGGRKADPPTIYSTHLTLVSKLKHCLRHSRHLQAYFQSRSPTADTLPSNFSYFYLLEHYAYCLLNQPAAPALRVDFLETCPSPYLHCDPAKPYTLVLDLDQTLIHYRSNSRASTHKGEFLIRPHMFDFLERMSTHYELGIFTCSMPEYADIIIAHMKHIQFRLYRHHTIRLNGEYVKDLSRLGRDLAKVILVDNLEANFRLQKQNGVHVRSWYGEKGDDVLRLLGDELKKLAQQQVQDVRTADFARKFL